MEKAISTIRPSARTSRTCRPSGARRRKKLSAAPRVVNIPVYSLKCDAELPSRRFAVPRWRDRRRFDSCRCAAPPRWLQAFDVPLKGISFHACQGPLDTDLLQARKLFESLACGFG